jgi:diadenosine tetraphosphatase ApaH/serine/threonine PP2A family protein phosphatase
MSPHLDDTLEAPGSPPGRVAILSDIHANLTAFEAVLADVRREEPDAIWCLGDLVGYGAEPDGCVALAAEACDLCLVGNHDLVVLDRLDIAAFSPTAAAAARWTRTTLSQEARAFLEGLQPMDDTREIGLYHASPRDPVWEYVLSPLLAEKCIAAMEPRVGAIGHSHVALSFSDGEGGQVVGRQLTPDDEVDLSTGRWLVNPGAVGQPRDGDPRAAWMLLDLGRWTATWRRTPYEIDLAAQAIREAGLPAALADRLYYGQ